MTREEIIELAKQAGIDIGMWEKLSDNDDVFGYDFCGIHENLEAFAKLVAKRTWVGLTAKEKHEIRYSHMTSAEFIEVIEAKLKEKNNG